MTKEELEKYKLRIEELKIKFSIALKTRDYYKANTYAEEIKKITKRIKKEYKEAKKKDKKYYEKLRREEGRKNGINKKK